MRPSSALYRDTETKRLVHEEEIPAGAADGASPPTAPPFCISAPRAGWRQTPVTPADVTVSLLHDVWLRTALQTARREERRRSQLGRARQPPALLVTDLHERSRNSEAQTRRAARHVTVSCREHTAAHLSGYERCNSTSQHTLQFSHELLTVP